MTVARLHVEWDRLGAEDAAWLRAWLASRGEGPVDVEDVWRAMDRAWEEAGCDGRRPDPARLAAFYRHPVWTLNGLFVGQDPESRGMREAIARWLSARLLPGARILDFGGGLGTLALAARAAVPDSRVDLLEPFPSPSARAALASADGVRFVADPNGPYDAVLCTDVLEHMTDPVGALAGMCSVLRPGGLLVVANNFTPVVRCHLPSTFHLRLTFRLFARLSGLVRLGPCPGSHAEAYRRGNGAPVPIAAARALEAVSRLAFPLLRGPHAIYRRLRYGAPATKGAA